MRRYFMAQGVHKKMDRTRTPVERVRPILQAMERSIDAARRRRLDQDHVTTPPPASPADPITERQGPPPRLKARPKRSNPSLDPLDDMEIRSQAS